MSIIKNLFERKATTVAAIKDKLRELETANPLADVERLQNERRTLLLASDADDKIVKLEQQIAAAQREEDRRLLAVDAVRKQLVEAEAAEHAAEVVKRVAAAKRALKKMPDLLAVYETAAKQIEDVIEGIGQVQEVIDLANAALPSGEQLPSAEFQFRGGIAPEPRREVPRKDVGEFWVLATTGEQVPDKLLASLQIVDGKATIEVVDPSPRSTAGTDMREIPEHRRDFHDDYWHRRRVAVKRMRRVDVEFLEHRSGWSPVPLRVEVGTLPSVLPVGGDPRKPREQITVRHVEAVEAPAAKTDNTEAA